MWAAAFLCLIAGMPDCHAKNNRGVALVAGHSRAQLA
jgi:hypothetical protein